MLASPLAVTIKISGVTVSSRVVRAIFTVILAAAVAGVIYVTPMFEGDAVVGKLLEATVWLLSAFLANNLLVMLLWQGLIPLWTGREVQKLVMQVSGFTVILIALGIVLVRIFDVPVAWVLATSGILIAIVGFALRNMISDLFTGIALGFERPFSLGDWIQLADGTVGKVVEMNWRSTRLITREEVTVIIPNSELAVSTFKNFSMPERYWRDEFDLLLGHDVTAYQAERVLLSAITQVPELARIPKPPEVRIDRYTENGIVWSVRYWVPDYPEMPRLRYEVQKAASRNLHYAGLRIPGQRIKVDDESGTPISDVDREFLKTISLFNELSDYEIDMLESSMTRHLFLKNENVVQQGDDGTSLFMVKEGLLEVDIRSESGNRVTVAHLKPGSFFGEMSLLTGEPRGATVRAVVDSMVYEVDKEDFEPLVRTRPAIIEALSELLSRRQRDNKVHDNEQRRLQEAAEGERRLLEKMRSFFLDDGREPRLRDV